MQTSIKYDALSKAGNERLQRKFLAEAISWELSLPQKLLDINKNSAVGMTGKVIQRTSAPDISLDSIKHYLHKLMGKQFGEGYTAKYATPDANPILTDRANEMQSFFHSNLPEMDMGFINLFDLIDLRGVAHTSFDIIDTNAGLTFTQRKPGERANIRRNISESKTNVEVLEFADGLGILDRWLQFNQFWNVDQAVNEFRAQYYDKMAALHYALFTALGSGVNEAFATDDETTFNNAAASILRAVRGKGYNAGQNAQFDILTNPEMLGRIEKMLTAQKGSPIVAYGTAGQPLAYTVRNVISTTHVPADSTGYYLVLPGRKLKRGLWKDLSVESDRDIEVSATNWVGHGQYNGAIGDSDQVRRVLFS